MAVLVALAALGGFVPPATADQVAGTVSRLKGDGFVERKARKWALSVGMEVHLGDEVSTGDDSRLEITMVDGAALTLGDAAVLEIEDYLFNDRQSSGNGLLNILQGVFQVASGQIASLSGDTLVVNTPVATIGIRGTTIWGGPIDGNYGVALLDGKGIYVETDAGRVEIDRPGQGTTLLGRDQPPGEPERWPRSKMVRARATVGF